MQDLEIIVVSPADDLYIDQCVEIARENHISKGGFIPYLLAVKKSCDYIICAVNDDKVLGYLGVNFNRLLKEFIITQVAVTKKCQAKGIGTKLMTYLKEHSLQAKKIISFVEKRNINSIKMHRRVGYCSFDEGYDYLFEINTSIVKDNQCLDYVNNQRDIEYE